MKFYRGIVIDNIDPNKSGRVKVRIFELHGLPDNTELIDGKPNENLQSVTDDNLPWAEVMQPIDFMGFSEQEKESTESFALSIDGTGSKSGKKTIEYTDKNPGTGYNRIMQIGTWVYCVLDNDNPNFPIVIGSLAANNEYTQSSAYRVYDSPKGHYEEFNDETGDIIIHNKNSNELILGNETTAINASQKFNLYAKDSINSHTDGKIQTYAEGDIQVISKGAKTEKIQSSYSIESQDFNLKAQTNTAVEANSQVNIKGNSQIQIESNGVVQVKGSMIMLG